MGNTSMAEKYLQLPTQMAYIKHIRWFGPPNGTDISCKFGAEVKAWDPEHTLIVQARLPCSTRLASNLRMGPLPRLQARSLSIDCVPKTWNGS